MMHDINRKMLTLQESVNDIPDFNDTNIIYRINHFKYFKPKRKYAS